MAVLAQSDGIHTMKMPEYCHSYGENDCPHNPKPICLWEITPEKVLEKCYELVE